MDDRHKTTFITPWGRYRYLSTQHVYIALRDGYARLYDEIVADIGDKTVVRYDRGELLPGCPMAGPMWLEWNRPQPREVRLRRIHSGLCRFHDHHDDVRPCTRYLEVIRDFPEPHNIIDVRSWFGLVNQVAYAFSMAERMHPFRKLLENGERFTW